MIKRIGLLLLPIVCCTYSVVSCAHTLTLSQILSSARHHFPVIRAAEENVNIARAQLLTAKGSFDPRLISNFKSQPDGGYENNYSDTHLAVPIVVGGATLFLGYRIGRGAWPVYYQNFLTNSGGELRYGLDLPLLRNFKIDPQRARVMTQQFNIALQQQSVYQTLNDTLFHAGIAYWEWIKAARTMQYAQQLLSLAMVRQKALIRRHRLGDLAHIEIVENNRFIFQRRAALVLAKQNYIRSSIFLSLYYRNAAGQPIIPRLKNVPNQYPIIPSRKLDIRLASPEIDRIILSNPLVVIFDRKLEIQRVKLKLVNNQLLPNLDLQLSSEKQYGSGGDPRLLPTEHIIALNFSLPLPRRAAKGRYQEIQSTIRRLKQQRRYQKELLHAELDSFLNELENDRLQFFLLGQEVNAAKQVERAEIIRFKEGDSSLFLVNQREQATFAARIQSLQAEIAYYETKVNLQRVCAFTCKKSAVFGH